MEMREFTLFRNQLLFGCVFCSFCFFCFLFDTYFGKCTPSRSRTSGLRARTPRSRPTLIRTEDLIDLMRANTNTFDASTNTSANPSTDTNDIATPNDNEDEAQVGPISLLTLPLLRLLDSNFPGNCLWT